MPKVSVILAIYNVEDYLKRCLDSICNQTLKDIEIICVNDCSTDNSLEILKEYSNKDERIKIIDLEVNSGAAVARNKGLEIAKGEYLGFIDPDDEIDLNYYEELYKKAKEDDYDIVKCKRKNIDVDGRVYYHPINSLIANKGKYFFNYEWTTAIYKSSIIFDNNIKFPQECRKAQDIVFLTKVVFKSETLALIDNVEYIYHQRENSLNSKKIPIESLKSALKASSLLLDIYNNSDLCSKNKKLYFELYLYQLNAMLNNTLFQNDSFEAKELCAKWLIDEFFNCKDIKTLNKQFKFIHFIKLIKNKKIKELATKLAGYSDNEELSKAREKWYQKFFSIKNQGDSKIIKILGQDIKIKRHKK